MKAKRTCFGGLVLAAACALLCLPAAGQPERTAETPSARQTPKTDFGAMLNDTIELEQALEIEAARSARAAQAFGASLTAADRVELEGACTALVGNPNDAAASQRLERMMSRYRDNSAEAITRFCLDPVITKLRDDVQMSRRTLDDLNAGRGSAQANVDLQNTLQKQQQIFTSVSNVLKTRHDTAKNSISNVR
jgi:hypothetical protein